MGTPPYWYKLCATHKRGFMLNLDKNSQADDITAFNDVSGYLYDI